MTIDATKDESANLTNSGGNINTMHIYRTPKTPDGIARKINIKTNFEDKIAIRPLGQTQK